MTRVPLVSVISIFLNAEKFLAEAVESVLAQDFQDFELLLVDDGSSDSSSAMARGYAERDERVRYLEHPGHVNRGMSATRNLGLANACGEYVAFIDADDRWRPSKLTGQLAIFDRLPEVDAVCGTVNYWSSHSGGTDTIVPTGHVLNRPVSPPEALLKVYPLGKADPPCPSDLLMRKSVVDAVGGFEESFTGPLQLYEDQAFLVKLYLQGIVYFSDRVWLDYRVHEQSCTLSVVRDGLGPEMRRRCLEWFESYLAGTRYRHDLRIRFSLMRALRPYRHPHVSKAGRFVKSLLGRAA